MGEVGVSAGENPTESLSLNGDLNGSCDEDDHDEPMDVDDPLEASSKSTNVTTGRPKDNNTLTDDDLTEEDNSTTDTNHHRQTDDGDDDDVLKNNGDEKTRSSVPDDDDDDGSDDGDGSDEDDEEHDGENGRQKGGDRDTGAGSISTGDDITEDGQKTADLSDADEVHDIPDSDEEEAMLNNSLLKSTTTEPQKSSSIVTNKPTTNIVEAMEVDGGQSNGHALDDDDKPVSIPSDSESESEESKSRDLSRNEIKMPSKLQITPIKQQQQNSDEVHEILSDKEDCVVVEDSNNKEDNSPRRSQRQRKSIVKVRNFADFDDDVEEVVIGDSDPLQTSRSLLQKNRVTLTPTGPSSFLTSTPTSISISNARSLATSTGSGGGVSGGGIMGGGGIPQVSLLNKFGNQAVPPPLTPTFNSNINNKKEPTLVIIDTNSILRGNAQPQLGQKPYSINTLGVPAQVYPRTTISAVPPKNMSLPTPPPPLLLPQQHQINHLLPALTDDMFVLEAPSFIVPYIYEKPPADNLKEVVSKISVELEERRRKEEEERKKAKAEEKLKREADGRNGDDEDGDEDGNGKEGDGGENSKAASKNGKLLSKRKKEKGGDDSWDELDTSTDDEASDSEMRTKVLIKEANEDIEDIKKHIITPETIKQEGAAAAAAGGIDPLKKENYFESPLGKFFMTIGINLVQEYVQTDLLRQQKRKRDREGGTTPANIQVAINSLMKNLEMSREQNEPFKFEMKRCEYCNFKSESSLAMAHHYETPHLKNYVYKCNFCTFETRPPHDILFHMEAVHNIKGRLEKQISYHQCPNCPFEDNGKSKLARHALVCAKKYRPEVNLLPPNDWEPPAKIPRIKPKHGLVGTATAYQVIYYIY